MAEPAAPAHFLISAFSFQGSQSWELGMTLSHPCSAWGWLISGLGRVQEGAGQVPTELGSRPLGHTSHTLTSLHLLPYLPREGLWLKAVLEAMEV